jgi:hypothetical protein
MKMVQFILSILSENLCKFMISVETGVARPESFAALQCGTGFLDAAIFAAPATFFRECITFTVHPR